MWKKPTPAPEPPKKRGFLSGVLRFFARLLLSLAVLAVIVGGGVGATIWWAKDRVSTPGPNTTPVRIFIPKRSGLSGTTAALSDAGLLPGTFDPWLFAGMIEMRHTAPLLKAGEYDIPPFSSLSDIADRLQSGLGLVRHPLTVPEGLTTGSALKLVQAMPELVGAITLHPGEGLLLPETYDVLREDERDAVIRRMMTAMDKEIDTLWATRAPGVPLANKHEAVVLASIVERETALPAERPHIASVFLNRLTHKPPMRLQSDPTVIYGLSPQTGVLDHPLSHADLLQDTPYNTYTRFGLPAQAICNPGKASLEAVLHPATTDDLYFVADGAGGHAFAATLAENNRNVAAWLARDKEKATSPKGD